MEHFNISIHDITKSTLKNVKKLKEILKEEGMEKISYLLIPYYHEKECLTEIADEIKSLVRNGEPILHGYTHKGKKLKKLSPTKLLTDNEGEFISHNNIEERLIKGKEILKKINIEPEGFIAPAWLMKKRL
ncbi:DUF2334 domain-containing protein [Desulfurobacterium indicum]|uniref:DUF2334 domain-containing protein n=1 Tax=Desulfurobacterium indicum TaxID=1914305 RepID=UPI00098F1DF6|nr:DUF2334 domain-containing protein [Desulfurobacterium indicum]